MNTNKRSSRVPFVLVSGAGRYTGWTGRLALPCALASAMLLAAGCSSVSLSSAPVEDRRASGEMAIPLDSSATLPPGAENAGKPGYYTVKPGDSMMRIGQSTGQNWRDIVRWNNIQNPNLIEVGQVLRVVPPASSSSTRVPVIAPTTSVVRPSTPVVVDPPASSNDDNVGWIWPAQGTLISGFNEANNKGVDIAGKAGDPVMASADGRVVYAGSGLRGYGNLIILKHNETFLTAYAHNRTLLVKEDQVVRKGQRIAEMGNTDTDRVKLHFEIRRQSKPVDPARYLPSR